MPRTTGRQATALLLTLLTLACEKKGEPQGPVVAKGKGIAITAAEVEARIAEQPPVARDGFASLDRKKQLLDGLLRFELLAGAAEKEGLDRDPEVRYAMRRVLVAKYYQRFFQDPAAAAAVSDAEVESYYQSHPTEFNRPARTHALQLLVAAPAGGPDRARRREEAQRLLARVLEEEKKSPGAFAAVARERSDDGASRPRGGDSSARRRRRSWSVPWAPRWPGPWPPSPTAPPLARWWRASAASTSCAWWAGSRPGAGRWPTRDRRSWRGSPRSAATRTWRR